MSGYYRTASLAVVLSWLWAQGLGAEERRLDAYECDEDGTPSFSDSPCGADEQRVEVGYDQPSADDLGATQQRAADTEVQADVYLQQIELQRAIARSEGRISDLRKERDAKLLQLHSSLNNAEGRATHSIWNSGVREQMADVAAGYDSDIEGEQIKLEALLRRKAETARP